MKRVLLTGAGGFIGRYVSALLCERGYEVHAVSSREVAETMHGIRWHRADLLDNTATSRLMEDVRPSYLLHLAWYAEPGMFWHSQENFRWLEASIALLRLFREQGGERVVVAGTCAEYDWNYGYCSEVITPRRPETPYGVCKNALYETMSAYCAGQDMSGAWGRIFFLYGPGEHPARLVASIITDLLRGGDASCTHGNQIRDFLHVEDVASAFVALLDSTVEGAVNIASGRAVTVREVVNTIADYIGARERVKFGAITAPESEPPLLVADVRRLAGELGWESSFDLSAGIAQTIRHWQAQAKA